MALSDTQVIAAFYRAMKSTDATNQDVERIRGIQATRNLGILSPQSISVHRHVVPQANSTSQQALVCERTYDEYVAELHQMIDRGEEPSDADFDELHDYGNRAIERDIPQLFYRRALMREEQIERAQELERKQRIIEAGFDNDLAYAD